MTKDVPVGVVGVGLMGEAFAGRLLVGGHKVVGFDRDASRMGKLAALGATPATSVAEMARTLGAAAGRPRSRWLRRSQA